MFWNKWCVPLQTSLFSHIQWVFGVFVTCVWLLDGLKFLLTLFGFAETKIELHNYLLIKAKSRTLDRFKVQIRSFFFNDDSITACNNGAWACKRVDSLGRLSAVWRKTKKRMFAFLHILPFLIGDQLQEVRLISLIISFLKKNTHWQGKLNILTELPPLANLSISLNALEIQGAN